MIFAVWFIFLWKLSGLVRHHISESQPQNPSIYLCNGLWPWLWLNGTECDLWGMGPALVLFQEKWINEWLHWILRMTWSMVTAVFFIWTLDLNPGTTLFVNTCFSLIQLFLRKNSSKSSKAIGLRQSNYFDFSNQILWLCHELLEWRQQCSLLSMTAGAAGVPTTQGSRMRKRNSVSRLWLFAMTFSNWTEVRVDWILSLSQFGDWCCLTLPRA